MMVTGPIHDRLLSGDKTVLKRIAGVLTARWFVTLFGAGALAILIWTVAPMIPVGSVHPLESPTVRVIGIAGVLLVWGFWNLLAERKAARINADMIKGLTPSVDSLTKAAGADKAVSDEELAVVRQRLQDALAQLKKAQSDRWGGQQYLYQVPWYLMIGPPGSGKTTALLNAGLVFPLADKFGKEPLRGVAGTRNCDWLFTDEAVLIDTAGRYITQDSREPIDQAAWLGFLDLLKTFRPLQPVNSVLVAISLEVLMAADPSERTAHAKAIRRRLCELHDKLQVRFPIYVLLTKSDLIAGFVEFFEDLGREGREQVWGMTFPLDARAGSEGLLPLFSPEFDGLVNRLNDRVIERIHQERDIGRRSLIFGFPAQFASLKQPLEEFLVEIFHPSRFEQRPLLRGIYFTSGTQKGAPIDRLMSAIAATFGLAQDLLTAFSGAGRAYFLNRLMRGVVFAEAGMVAGNPRLERRQAIVRRVAYAAAAAVLLASVGAWYAGYAANQRMIDEVEASIGTYREQIAPLEGAAFTDSDILRVLPALNTLRTVPGGYAKLDAIAPIGMWLGLYQGDKLGEGAAAAYQRGLDKLFMPSLLARLQEQLRANMTRADLLQDTLKVYLILGNRGPMNADLVRTWMRTDWQARYPGRANEVVRQEMADHLDALLEGPLSEAELDAPIIHQARQSLARIPLAARVFGSIKQSERALRLPEWRISDHGGPAVDRVFERKPKGPLSEGIPGLYTYEGFHGVMAPTIDSAVQQIAKESWVLADTRTTTLGADELDRLESEVKALYVDDYAGRWATLLADLTVVPMRDLQQTVEVLNILSGSSSPLRSLLTEIAHQTTLAQPPRPPDGTSGTSPQSQSAQGQAPNGQPAGQKSDAGYLTTWAEPIRTLDQRFRQLQDFVRGRQGRPPQLDDTLRMLNDVFMQVNLIAAGGSGSTAERAAAVQRLRAEAGSLPEPLNRMVSDTAAAISNISKSNARKELNQKWASEVLPLCTRALEGRYPFGKKSGAEVTLDDFARLFAPGGLIDGFFSSYLAGYVDTSRLPWRPRQGDPVEFTLSESVVSQFQKAATIRDAFFAGGAKNPMVKFELVPLSLDGKATQVLLDLDGQTLTYAYGPIRPVRMQWPSPNGQNEVRMAFSPAVPGQPSSISKMGTWAWFRLLDEAPVQPGTLSDRFELKLSTGSYWAAFELRASSVVNPFGSRDWEGFRCPSSL